MAFCARSSHSIAHQACSLMASISQAATLAAAMPLAIIDGAFREVLAAEGEESANFVPKFLERAAAKFADIFSVPGALEAVR